MFVIDSTIVECHDKICHFSLKQMCHYISLLNDFGLEFVEIPNITLDTPWELQDLIEFKKSNNLKIQYIINIDLNSCKDIDQFECISIKYIHDQDTLITNVLKKIKQQKSNICIFFSIENYFEIDQNNLSNLLLSIEDYIDIICIKDNKGTVHNYSVIDALCFIKNICNPNLKLGCNFNNDTQNAVSNSFIAINEGFEYVTTSVLGLSNNNGITDFSALLCKIYTTYPEYLDKYNLYLLKIIELYISHIAFIALPINHRSNIITRQMLQIDTNILLNTYSKIIEKDLLSKVFIFHEEMNWYDLKIFIYLYLPKVFINLDFSYIRLLCDIIKTDISINPRLYIDLNNDQNYCIDYILNYIN